MGRPTFQNGNIAGLGANEVTNIVRTREYVNQRVAGTNKRQAALLAGYSHNKANSVSLLEKTNGYKLAINRILDTTSTLILDSLEATTLMEINALPVKERITVLKQLAEIHKILMPTVKIKDETMKDGTVKTTKWQSIGEK